MEFLSIHQNSHRVLKAHMANILRLLYSRWAVENGITTGIGNGRFDPTSACTRAQIAAFLARSMK